MSRNTGLLPSPSKTTKKNRKSQRSRDEKRRASADLKYRRDKGDQGLSLSSLCMPERGAYERGEKPSHLCNT
jgi:hypothetical protein